VDGGCAAIVDRPGPLTPGRAAVSVGHTARVAGLLHLATHLRDGWAKPVDEPTVLDAIAIAKYFADDALTVFDFMGVDPTLGAARAVAAWLGGREEVTRRDVHRAHAARFRLATDVEPAPAAGFARASVESPGTSSWAGPRV
jgi:hypothetical protein